MDSRLQSAPEVTPVNSYWVSGMCLEKAAEIGFNFRVTPGDRCP